MCRSARPSANRSSGGKSLGRQEGSIPQCAFIIDAADYFKHVKAAMLRARHRIILVGWDFDARMTFERGAKLLPGPNQLSAFLYWMLWKRSDLDIYLLRSN